MARLYITEFASMGTFNQGGPVQAGQHPPLADQTPVVIGVASLRSVAFGANTNFIRVNTDAICSVAIGEPTIVAATIDNMRLAANQTEYFAVKPGHKLAVISNT